MAGKKSHDVSFSNLCLLLTISSIVLSIHGVYGTAGKIPVIFIFGDSTLDVGTNNFLPHSTAKANFPYNGIDFPYSIPTGRFSNGLNSADQIVRQFGYEKSPPPFLSLLTRSYTFKAKILRGVNFASAGSGILHSTGLLRSGQVVSLEEQVQQFVTVQGNITELLGYEAATNFVSNSLFLISIGSNDIFEFSPSNSSAGQANPQDHLAALQSSYKSHLENLYKLGARKFGIVSVPPIGCCPAIRAADTKTGRCNPQLNDFAQAFHSSIDVLLQTLSHELEGMKYSLGNGYKMTTAVLENPSAFGIEEVEKACCGKGRFNGEAPCNKSMNPNLCGNRNKYLFWDLFHPTEFASNLAGSTLYSGGLEFVTPMNLSQLALITY